ncbi:MULTISPECIES: AsmA family protein [Providencia]|uniref:AsmA family protein n=1 Tax=Providencia TaxID=586 RepID=UPI0004F623D2|nr:MULTISPECIES: AsmA family protein [Providencia]AIN65870.1 asmA family protein [Providencia stuartii]EMD1717288.1 AsmA family protein [Providencia stuartii]EMD1719727.1 AsmA family protein [Providencia stuartii]EMF0918642.1 AsmA family protein [Providencia stuartii]MBG5897197.1 AsmA family protein [Providencia stuartii]
MRWLTKLIIALLLLFLLAVIFTYAGLQTRWGASYASHFLSKFTDFDIDVGIMGHEFSNAGEFVFQDVKIASRNQDMTLDAKQIVVDVNWRNLFSGTAIRRFVITQGNLAATTSETSTPIPLSANILQFENSNIQLNQAENRLQVSGFTGGITPWQPTTNHPFGYGDFRFTTKQLDINELPLKNVAITGKLQENLTEFTDASGYLNNGYITGSGKALADGSITINSLAMDKVGWQNSIPFDSLREAIESQRTISLKNVALTNVDLQGKDWAISGLNTEIDHINWVRGSWSSPKSHINFTVNQLVIKDQQVDTLIGDLNIQGDNLNIEKLSGYYYKGVFSLNGVWQRNDQTLTLNDAKLAGILYTLPENWLQFFSQPSPNWLSGLTIKQFTLSQSLLMNIDSRFPFELTALSGNVENVSLIKQKQWGIWSGKASFNADSGTVNQVMIRRPYMDLRQSGQASAAASLTASTDKGVVKVGLLVKQSPKKVPFLLRASGTNVDLSVLNQWGWQGFPPQVIGDFDTSLQGDLLAPSLAKSVNGELVATPLQGKQMYRTVVNGVVTSSVESDAPPTESQPVGSLPTNDQLPALLTQ